MNKSNATGARKILEEPFSSELIKQRDGAFGQQLSYVEAHHYIQRLNEAFEGKWSFVIVQHEVTETEVIVIGKLITAKIIKMAFGSSAITRRKDSKEILCLGDDLKAAATDSLKKASSFLGLGLHLYGSHPKVESAKKKSNGKTKGNGNSRLTSRQLAAIIAIGRDHGLDRTEINQMGFDRYGRNLEFISKADASSLIQELHTI